MFEGGAAARHGHVFEGGAAARHGHVFDGGAAARRAAQADVEDVLEAACEVLPDLPRPLGHTTEQVANEAWVEQIKVRVRAGGWALWARYGWEGWVYRAPGEQSPPPPPTPSTQTAAAPPGV